MLTFEVCHVRSTDLSGFWPQTKDYTQIVADGPFDATFTSKRIVSSHIGCLILAMNLSSDNVTFVSSIPGYLDAPVQVPDSQWEISASNRSDHAIYQFYIQAYAKGSQLIGDDMYTLVVGCHAPYTMPQLSPDFVENIEHWPRTNTDYHVAFPDFWPYNWCSVTHVTPIVVSFDMYKPPKNGTIFDPL
jgi:hypothetical protein